MPAKGQLTGYYINCENCGKEVYKTKSQYNKAIHHFCSTKCQKEFEHNNLFEDRICEICKKSFRVSKKSNQRFCSIVCQGKWQSVQTGILNPRYKKQKIKCEYCGNEYYEKLHKINNGQHKFCSNECRRNWYSNVFSQGKNWREESRRRAVRILESGVINTNSKPQLLMNSLLDEMNILYTNEKGFVYYAVDNYLNDYNLIIEVMGDFWHSNPLKYSVEKISDIQKKRIIKDKAKHTFIKNQFNIEILYLWENDIYNNLDICQVLIDKYIQQNGKITNYYSFNYRLENGNLILNDNIITPYQDMVNA